MEIIRLSEAQVIELYPCMEEAFPPDELKPLDRILFSLHQNAYDCLGLKDGERLKGYAYFVRTQNHV